MIDAPLQDARLALRQMARSRRFSALALVAIAVGIGANATVFSFFTALHLATLAAPDAEHLVTIHRIDERGTGDRRNLSGPEYAHLQQHAASFSGVITQDSSWVWLSHGDRSVEVEGGRVSPNYFDVLGLTPAVGGFFSGAGSLERARAYQRELLRSVEAVPGVERAVIARVPPDRGWCCEIEVARAGDDPIAVEQNEVSPGFLSAMAISLLEGRDFEDGDRHVAIVNQALAQTLWPNQRAVDNELRIAGEPHRVIAVAVNAHAIRPGEAAYPYLYLPMWSRDVRDPRLFVRVSGRAGPMLERLRRAVVAVDPDVHVGQESTLAGRARRSAL